MKKTILVTVLALVVFYMGFVIGTVQSAATLDFLDAPVKGALSINELKLLRENNIEAVINKKETEVDVAIYNHVRFREGVYGFLSWPLSSLHDYSKYAQIIIEHRNLYPIRDYTKRPGMTADQLKYWSDHKVEMERRLSVMREWYEDKSPDK